MRIKYSRILRQAMRTSSTPPITTNTVFGNGTDTLSTTTALFDYGGYPSDYDDDDMDSLRKVPPEGSHVAAHRQDDTEMIVLIIRIVSGLVLVAIVLVGVTIFAKFALTRRQQQAKSEERLSPGRETSALLSDSGDDHVRDAANNPERST
ncbi:hypothetical protein GCK32_015381 [Trichostrongylus colubriformis]|uniref:Uncharacterized protein n=1 Tax=Trichostrongylus colubriformis TaxID=6319 RepID=A0AAN8J207_TRICO